VNQKKNSVRVRILGEEYTVRTDASPDRARAIAQYFDRAVRQILTTGHVPETHRAAILAGLQITGELFEARDAADELTASLRSLTHEIREVVDADGLRPAEVDTAT
jgi:cell division protein ZapA